MGDTIYTCQTASFAAGGNYASYLWTTGDTTKSISVKDAGVYKVQLKNGCGLYETTYHSIKSEAALYNLITPDGNEKNDQLIFSSYPLPATLQVYDRWGKQVYHNNDYHNDWEGETYRKGFITINSTMKAARK